VATVASSIGMRILQESHLAGCLGPQGESRDRGAHPEEAKTAVAPRRLLQVQCGPGILYGTRKHPEVKCGSRHVLVVTCTCRHRRRRIRGGIFHSLFAISPAPSRVHPNLQTESAALSLDGECQPYHPEGKVKRCFTDARLEALALAEAASVPRRRVLTVYSSLTRKTRARGSVPSSSVPLLKLID
jgi:hypothetical protein